jgi:hypothetical protein
MIKKKKPYGTYLTFGEYPEKYVVIIPKNEIEDYYKKLFEGIAEKIS